jgi:hypothetical protein
MNQAQVPPTLFDELAPETRQFRLSTILGLTVLSAVAFALVRLLKLEGVLHEYAYGFRRSPISSSLNLPLYVFGVWLCSRQYRALCLPQPPARRTWPLNGAFFGTIFGAAFFGMTVCFCFLCHETPFLCGSGMLAGCLLASVGAVVPAVLIRVLLEPRRPDWSSVGGNMAFGALLGAATGYVCVSPIALYSVLWFLGFGLVPALVGAACGARGAFLQVVAERHLDRPIAVADGDPSDDETADGITAEGEAA